MEINGSIFIQIAIFLGILFSLSKLLFSPMLRLFDARERLINGSRDDAEKMREKADALSLKFQEEYNASKQEAVKFFGEMKAKANKKYEEEISKTKEESLQTLKQSDEKLLSEENVLKSKLDAMSDELAKEIISSFKKA